MIRPGDTAGFRGYGPVILLLALALAIAWSFARGGRFSPLQTIPIRGWELAVAAFGIQIVVIYLLPATWGNSLRVTMLFISYVLLAVLVWLNRRQQGMWLLGAGLLANWIVILANGGHMPVSYEALVAAGRSYLLTGSGTGSLVLASKDILLPPGETRLWFLSDIFVLAPPFPIPAVFSVGDLLIAIGLFRFVAGLFRAPAQERTATGANSI